MSLHFTPGTSHAPRIPQVRHFSELFPFLLPFTPFFSPNIVHYSSLCPKHCPILKYLVPKPLSMLTRRCARYTYILIAFFAVISSATFLLILLRCIPVQGSWDLQIKARCIARSDVEIIARTQGGMLIAHLGFGSDIDTDTSTVFSAVRTSPAHYTFVQANREPRNTVFGTPVLPLKA